MSNLPFTLPACEQPATGRIEIYDPTRPVGSLDASAYVCDQHSDDAALAILAAGLIAQRVPLSPAMARTCGHVYTYPTGSLAGNLTHPTWCDRDECVRRQAHCSAVRDVDTGRVEETALAVVLVQYLHPAAQVMVSLTALDGVTGGERILMSLGQARVLVYRLRQLLDASAGGAR
ncbi:hypothetical protein [Micromonospora sp. HUAS LYJ1]|uniref:hypothetical protein n=1 Tax=Micromonospora sp. HUAS LYJ1 TaxID=3061626 RepID=UPI0026713704|nr:hypothetical protein [Micromonospora sp. HUAS LYJ1]WKU03835.1 hypothetical protein Q2K16_23795 [Micromonospora sp. HUAS LYJ1]